MHLLFVFLRAFLILTAAVGIHLTHEASVHAEGVIEAPTVHDQMSPTALEVEQLSPIEEDSGPLSEHSTDEPLEAEAETEQSPEDDPAIFKSASNGNLPTSKVWSSGLLHLPTPPVHAPVIPPEARV